MNYDGWITLDDFCEKYQQQKGTVHKRVQSGAWPRGEIYSSPNSTTAYIHEERAVAWLKEKNKFSQVSSGKSPPA